MTDKGSKFYNRLMASCLEDHNIEMYSTSNKGRSIVAERFIRTLKNKIYKYMTSLSIYVYINKLTGNEYNNAYHSTIKMKPADVMSSTYIDFNVENNDKYPKFGVYDHVRVSKFKNIFAKRYAPNWSEEASLVKLLKNTFPWIYIIEDLNGKKVVGTLYEK